MTFLHISSKCDIFKIHKWILRQSIKNPAENFGKITQFKFQIWGNAPSFLVNKYKFNNFITYTNSTRLKEFYPMLPES